MSMENGKCPGCGSMMSLDSSREMYTCKFCGNEVATHQAIHKCQIDGITTFDALVLSAEQAIKYDEDYDKALKNYKEALNLKPNNYFVLFGIFLCEMDSIAWYRRTKGFVQFPNDIPSCIDTAIRKWGQRAYDLAPDETKPYYLEKIEEARRLAELSSQEKKKGCYIATAVYGSYDCSQVWILRRYRDNKLDNSFFGRVFIKIYYAVSPLIIRCFAKSKGFNSFWRKRLDKKIKRLQKKGFEDTPYIDKY